MLIQRNINLDILVKYILLAMLVMLTSQLVIGCATESRTVKEEVVKTTDDDGDSSSKIIQKETVVVHDDDDGGSVLGSIFNVIGEIVALPFRLIGGLFRAIF